MLEVGWSFILWSMLYLEGWSSIKLFYWCRLNAAWKLLRSSEWWWLSVLKDKKTYKSWRYQLMCFLFCSSTLCGWRQCTSHSKSLSQHCDQKILCFILTGNENPYIDSAAEYISSYNPQGRVIECTVPVLLQISWFVGALLWVRLPKFNYRLLCVRHNSWKVGSTL